MSDVEAMLRLVRAADLARRRARTDLEVTVDAAREAGATWQQVADALGTTRQHAHRRYAHPAPPPERTT